MCPSSPTARDKKLKPTSRITAAPPRPAPNDSPIRALVVDDDEQLRKIIAAVLRKRGLEVHAAENGPAALEHLRANEPDVALVDLRMPGMDGFEVLARARHLCPDLAVIMMTGAADIGSAAAAATIAGAYHFLTKPFVSNEAVVLTILKAAEHRRLLLHARVLEEQLDAQVELGQMVGGSPKMMAVYGTIERVATASSTVLILGETGTGKELVARAIHRHSDRASKPLVTVNCGAIPKELVESELFGHVRGSFTGANTTRAGLLESAHGGVIFLDEVGDLPPPAQVKLLRALQEGEVKRVGSDETKVVDVRVIAATNVDLATKLESGVFRRDLYYRLNVIAIHLPPLRERADDILSLTEHFLRKLSGRMQRPVKEISAEAMLALRVYAWPGNVRELEHALEYAFVLARGAVIEVNDLPIAVASNASPKPPPVRAIEPPERARLLPPDLFDLPYAEAKRRAVAHLEREYVHELMRRCGEKLGGAAQKAGLDPSNFRRMLRKARTARD